MNLSIQKVYLIHKFFRTRLLTNIILYALLITSSFAQSHTLNFIVISDMGGSAGKAQKAVAAAMAKEAEKINAKFILTGGDNYHETGITSELDARWKTEFENVYSAPSLQVPWYPSLGNHDYTGNAEAEIKYSSYSNRWKLPSRYYAHTEKIDSTESVLIVHLDTSPFLKRYQSEDEKYHVSGQNTKIQVRWLDSVLTYTKAKWKLVIGHHPVYSDGSKHGSTNELIDEILPILKKHKTTAYLCGHDHILEHIHSDNMKFFVVGGGAKVREVKESHDEWTTRYVRFAKGSLGFLSVSLSTEKLIFRFISENRTVLHSGSITSN